jgi:hypothetical protein
MAKTICSIVLSHYMPEGDFEHPKNDAESFKGSSNTVIARLG